MSRISVRQLNLYYGSKHALRDVSMEIRGHAATAFIGPSGCGKSSLLKCINRMNDLAEKARIEGRILLDGEDVYDRRVDLTLLRRKVGMVFQQPNPFPMSVYDNVAYGPRLQGIKNRRRLDGIVEAALAKAALLEEVKDRMQNRADGLSGGQQQRLCIARALAVEPEVLLMDEPTSALDPVSTLRVEELVKELKRSYTIVIVTHNMQQAVRIADDAAFFLSGELVESGPAKTLFGHPRDRRTADYLAGRFG